MHDGAILSRSVASAHPLPLVPRPGPGRAAGDFVRRLGLVASAFSVVQIDINAVTRRGKDGEDAEVTLCDHNCTQSVRGRPTGGHYTCPASLSLNPGVGSRDVAPAELLVQGLLTTADGIRAAQQDFLRDDLPAYFREESVPGHLRPEFEAALRSRHISVNLFGGSPELHPGCVEIIEGLRDAGMETHLTTTGRRIVRDPEFRARLLRMPPDVLAVSADDFGSPDELDEWFALDPDALARLWRSVPAAHGQRRKAVEAVQICKLAEREPLPPLLFNIVLHPDNLAFAAQLLDRIGAHVPGAILNPYPVQSAFLGEQGALGEEDLARLRDVVEVALDCHVTRHLGGVPRWNLAPRLPYWLLLLSLLDMDADTAEVADRVGGAGVWTCYSRRGSGRCVQIGWGRPAPGKRHAGGHPGCFWNAGTVTHPRQFWDLGASEMAEWILDGRGRLARDAERPCAGCLFPRMSLDGVSLELGLDRQVTDAYRTVRKHYLGY
ncbi:radical SAM protein [Streptomyces sp. NPDC052012]|uniref:radical SAM protein n=1 Tax=Streptomyces sp. NPDC052012 TaxID=3155051 RepID=UPI00344D627C